MINKILIFTIPLLFSACIDVNLRSELPAVDYYKLDTSNAESTNCESFNFIALTGIDIPKEYQSKKIFYKENNKIKYFNNINFISNINQSFENMLIKEFNKKCLKIVLPPFSGISLENFLHIKLLDFDIVKQNENAKAIVNISYQITQKGNILQSGIITESKDLENFSEEEAIKALQETSLNAIETLSNNIIPNL
ncbi:hypothetical protein CCY99_03815 [Helicobacter sp. 16-1353]|uniref:hypothetical protein n=1 Tax=Helicobacter sp. 16-1353 TaxID=2004996 RepID=UPI000DCEB8F1|nr:hypothetical protein [Helicobacter sp. 16-1353]RAX54485.1 hypothetical protein CCY99_03815 [Helicobacter sp. 16-1353]